MEAEFKKRRAILHIGMPKTGTTSIQMFLSERRSELQKRGFHFAAAPGNRNHVALAAYGAREGYSGTAVRRSGGAAADGAAMGPRLQRSIEAEVASLPDHVHTVLFSSEQLATRPHEADGVANIKSLLESSFSGFQIVIYVRRQDEVAVSKYSTAIRSGGETDPSIIPVNRPQGSLYDFARIVDHWAAAFGRDAMIVRVFDRQSLVGGDVIADYLSVVGIDGLKPGDQAVKNPALNGETQELVRRVNVLALDQQAKYRPRIGRYLRTPAFFGKPRSPTRQEAKSFYLKFAEDNDRIRATYRPDLRALFSEDFSRYPDRGKSGVAAVPSDSKVLEVALEALLVVMEELRQARVAAGLLVAREATATEAPEARRRWSSLLLMEPDNEEALAALAGLDGRSGVPPAAAASPKVRRRAKGKIGRKAKRQAARAKLGVAAIKEMDTV